MRRREFITLLGGAAAWPVSARAQQGTQMRRAATISLLGLAGGNNMMRRAFRAALLSFAVAFTMLAGVQTSNAQQTKAIPRLCFLTFEPGTLESHSPRFEAFFVALRELGYVHGRNITIEFLSANANNDRFPELIAECLRLKPDVIAVTTTPAARLSKNATRDIPIVMVALGDPVGTGLVESLAKPGETSLGCRRWFLSLRPSDLGY